MIARTVVTLHHAVVSGLLKLNTGPTTSYLAIVDLSPIPTYGNASNLPGCPVFALHLGAWVVALSPYSPATRFSLFL